MFLQMIQTRLRRSMKNVHGRCIGFPCTLTDDTTLYLNHVLLFVTNSHERVWSVNQAPKYDLSSVGILPRPLSNDQLFCLCSVLQRCLAFFGQLFLLERKPQQCQSSRKGWWVSSQPFEFLTKVPVNKGVWSLVCPNVFPDFVYPVFLPILRGVLFQRVLSGTMGFFFLSRPILVES